MVLHWPYRDAHIFNRFFFQSELKISLNNSQRKLCGTLYWLTEYLLISFSFFIFHLRVVVVLTFKQLAKTHSLDTLLAFLHTHRKKTHFNSIPLCTNSMKKIKKKKKEKLSLTSCGKENHIHTYTLRQRKIVWTSRRENRNIERRGKK